MEMSDDVWAYRSPAEIGYDPTSGRDLTGYSVLALDGPIGKIYEASNDAGSSYLCVDSGLLRKKVMLPAGVVQRIDENEERVWVNRTKDQIKDAPERYADATYRNELRSYYSEGGRGYHDC